MKFDDFLRENYSGPMMRDEERELARKSNLGLDRKKHGPWTVWARTHAAARAFLRAKDVTKDEWEKLTKIVVDKVNGFTKAKVEKEYLFFSKSLNLGYTAAVDYPKNEIRIITILEPGMKAIRKPGTTWVMLQ